MNAITKKMADMWSEDMATLFKSLLKTGFKPKDAITLLGYIISQEQRKKKR